MLVVKAKNDYKETRNAGKGNKFPGELVPFNKQAMPVHGFLASL